jgi:AcrR family transcriptional regulator
LDPEKRQRILEAAAREFAAHGFVNASMNQILATADISKGAAYYYFDDKADLYATALTHYAGDVLTGLDTETIESLTAVTFWPTIERFYRRQLGDFLQRPWVFGLIKSASRLSPEAQAQQPLAAYFAQVMGLLQTLLARGREVGAIRDDLPDDLLMLLMMAVDDAHDQWLLDHWEEMDEAELDAAIGRAVENLRRLLAPTPSSV